MYNGSNWDQKPKLSDILTEPLNPRGRGGGALGFLSTKYLLLFHSAWCKYCIRSIYLLDYKKKGIKSLHIGMLTFSFFRKTIVSLWKRREKIENETIVFKNDRFFKVRFLQMVVFKTIVFQNARFPKRSFFKMIVFIKFVVSLTIFNDDPFVNDL